MNEEIKKTCDLILENRETLKKKMAWEVDANTYAIMAALISASRGAQADADRYKECKKILHENTSVFSAVRGLGEAVVVTKMMLRNDPAEYAQGVNEVYGKLRSIHKLTASAYMVLAAMNIYEHNGVAGADEDIQKLETLYKKLQKDHPLLISDEDRGYLSMIVTAEKEGAIDEKIEASYEACKKVSIDKNAVHSLAQVMALSDMTPERQSEFVKNMIKALKESKTPISREFGLTSLGALSLLGIPEEQLAADVAEASEYLKGKKGFKWFSVNKRLRTVFAALAVFITYAKDNDKLSETISSDIAVNIAEEIIMLIVIASCTTAAARNTASSSSSN